MKEDLQVYQYYDTIFFNDMIKYVKIKEDKIICSNYFNSPDCSKDKKLISVFGGSNTAGGVIKVESSVLTNPSKRIQIEFDTISITSPFM